MVSPATNELRPRLLCMGIPIGTGTGLNKTVAGLKPGTNTGVHWLTGIAADHTLPLRSIILVGDVFAERYEGIERPMDWTAELGGRTQITPRFVADIGLGRHFRGVSTSWFATFGTTVSLALRQ